MGVFLSAVVNGAFLGTALTAILAAGLRLAPRRGLNAATRYAVWWVAFAAVVLLPVAFLPQSRGRLASQKVAVSVPAVQVSTPGAALPNLPLVSAGPRGEPTFPLRLEAGPWTVWILAAWALASGLMLVRLMVSCLLLQRAKKRALTVPGELVEEWLALCGGSRRRVRLAASSGIGTPVVAGLWRPAILIPGRLLEQLDADELRQIGLHETAHLARRDDYALLLERVLEALWVWHPAVRWMARQIDLEREIACDDFVVKVTGQARPYAACLTRVVEMTGGVRGSVAAAAAAEERSHLTRRVNMLLDHTRNSATRLLKARFLVLLAVVGGLGFVAARLPGPVAFAMPQRPIATQSPMARAAIVVPALQAQRIPTPAPAPRIAPAVDEMMVKVPVVVQDPMHRAVTGLAKENFRIFEDGVEQEVVEFSNADTPTSFGIVFDGSGSTAARQDDARRAVAQFVKTAGAGSEFCLVEFHERATVASGFTSDAEQILGRLDTIRAIGGTSLWEAIVLALQQMKQGLNPAKAILVVTDGNDNTSAITAEQTKEAARAAGIPISAISFGDDRRGNAFLDELAALTGGRHISAENPADAGAVAGMATRNGYVLGYRPKNAAHDGAYRTLRVEVAPPRGLPPLTVRNRAGYYAPRQ